MEGGGAILVDISKFRGSVITKSLEILIELSIVIAQCTLYYLNSYLRFNKERLRLAVFLSAKKKGVIMKYM